MSSQTISLNAATWFKNNDSINHSSADWLKCTRPEASDNYAFAAILNFALPTALKYKRITKVQLYYYTRWMNGGYDYDHGFSGMTVAPYVCSNTAISQVTGASLQTYGMVGEYITVEPIQYYTYVTYPRWRVADITSIFASNLYENTYFSLIMRGLPGMTDASYGLIGSSTSGYSPYLVIDYEDVEQLPPTPSYPVGAYVNENTDLLFAWAWNSSTQAVQASVQLEYKLASADSWTTVILTQTGHTYTLAGGLPQGAYVWRIKGTNDAGETSGYSANAEFIVIGKPSAPVINNPANKALTEITWQANDQNSYDITLTDSNGVELINETVASSTSSYKPNLFLKGTYTVGIRYRNSTGLSSDWTYKTFAITAAGPAKPTMTLYGDAERARIVISRSDGISYALMRAEDPNGTFEVVGLFESEEYIDRTLKFNTPYIYKVRAYASAGYTDSDVARFKFSSDRISLNTDELELILEKSEEEFLPYTEDSTQDMAVYKCPGRRLPIVEHGMVDSWAFNSQMFVTEAQKETLRTMAREDYIFYRDYSGRAFPVAIRALTFTRWRNEGYIAGIEFIRIAEREVEVNV